ncbi:MAG: hypothetical protein JSW10_04900 [Pseudomonadota bacterium]|nr:MAG: hypothetical protein JSW10_04900 [Pseudomonadota bacterium]
MDGDKHREKDRWDKFAIVLRPVGGILTALAVAGVGFFGSQYLESRQAAETNVRLYAQLMSSREQADSDLRKEMFNSIIKAFLSRDSDSKERSIEDEILALELLAYNFHNVIDLGPLFKHVEHRIHVAASETFAAASKSDAVLARERALEKRLQDVALEVIGKQIATLREGGIVVSRGVDLKEFAGGPKVVSLASENLRLAQNESEPGEVEAERLFILEANDFDKARRQVRIRLAIHNLTAKEDIVDVNFWVGAFDFPMIDNTRLSGGRRAAVVLSNLGKEYAEVSLVYFPGSRASLKEKPYYDEVLDELVRTGKALREARE